MTVIPMTDQQPSTDLARYVTPAAIDQIARALPDGVSLSKFDQAFAVAMVKEPALEKADRTTLFLALVDAARRGLIPDGKQGAIVAFGGKAQFLPMIGGVRDTLAEYGWLLKTGTVYEKDVFSIDEAEARLKHERALGDDRGEIIGFYALATHRDGRQRMATYMSASDVNELRDKMGVANNPAWKKWYPQMGEKTVGHRVANDVPLAPQDRRRVEWILNATEIGPEESAASLYGDHARAAFAEIPAGHEFPPAEPVTEIADADPPAGDAQNDGGSGEPDPPAEGQEAQPPSTAADAAAATPEPDEEAVMLAADAAGFVPPSGKYADNGDEGPLDLAGILALGDDGRKYLGMLLRQLGEGEWREKTEAFARVHLPEEYAATLAAREPKAA